MLQRSKRLDYAAIVRHICANWMGANSAAARSLPFAWSDFPRFPPRNSARPAATCQPEQRL